MFPGGVSDDPPPSSDESIRASVVIVNYNDREFISDCLAAVLDQDMPSDEYEVVFADNGSEDGSADLVESAFPSVTLVRLDRNYLFSGGNNRAMEHVQGKYVVFLNVDTVVHRRWLPELVRAAEEDPEVRACQGNMLMPWVDEFAVLDREGGTQSTYFNDLCAFGFTVYHRVPFTPEPIRTLFLTGSSLLLERDLVEEMGYLFEAEFYACEDLDLSLRVNNLGYKTITVPTAIYYHKHPLSTKLSLNRSTLWKLSNLHVSRFIAYFKNMTGLEFLCFSPFMILGAPLKARKGHWGRTRVLAYSLGSLPLILFSFARALTAFPRYAPRRRDILRTRKRPAFWLFRRLINRTRLSGV